jgi:hypothetical protein
MPPKPAEAAPKKKTKKQLLLEQQEELLKQQIALQNQQHQILLDYQAELSQKQTLAGIRNLSEQTDQVRLSHESSVFEAQKRLYLKSLAKAQSENQSRSEWNKYLDDTIPVKQPNPKEIMKYADFIFSEFTEAISKFQIKDADMFFEKTLSFVNRINKLKLAGVYDCEDLCKSDKLYELNLNLLNLNKSMIDHFTACILKNVDGIEMNARQEAQLQFSHPSNPTKTGFFVTLQSKGFRSKVIDQLKVGAIVEIPKTVANHAAGKLFSIRTCYNPSSFLDERGLERKSLYGILSVEVLALPPIAKEIHHFKVSPSLDSSQTIETLQYPNLEMNNGMPFKVEFRYPDRTFNLDERITVSIWVDNKWTSDGISDVSITNSNIVKFTTLQSGIFACTVPVYDERPFKTWTIEKADSVDSETFSVAVETNLGKTYTINVDKFGLITNLTVDEYLEWLEIEHGIFLKPKKVEENLKYAAAEIAEAAIEYKVVKDAEGISIGVPTSSTGEISQNKVKFFEDDRVSLNEGRRHAGLQIALISDMPRQAARKRSDDGDEDKDKVLLIEGVRQIIVKLGLMQNN